MKKVFIIILSLVAVVAIYAQNSINVPKFMGIPIDGTEQQMIEKLQTKGFTQGKDEGWLEGKFNGQDVGLKLMTNKGKVYRVFIVYYRTESKKVIINEYNHLFEQFKNNKNYKYSYGKQLNDNENLSYHLAMQDKSYEASWVAKVGTIVWFDIISSNGRYSLLLRYDNPKNRPNGEDL